MTALTDRHPNAPTEPDDFIARQHIEAERAVLAAAILEPAAARMLTIELEPRQFYRVTHQRIAAAIAGMVRRNVAIDLITLAATMPADDLTLAGGPAALSQLLDHATTTQNVAQHCALVREAWRDRESQRIAHKLLENPSQRATLVDELRGIEQAGSGAGPDYSFDRRDFCQRVYDVPPPLLGQDLLAAGDLGVVFGAPSLGKSWVALMLCDAIARAVPWLGISGPKEPAPACYVALEVAAHRLQRRLRVLQGDRTLELTDENLRVIARPDLRGVVDILSADTMRWLVGLCRRHALKLIVLDALSRIHLGDDADTAQAAAVMGRCDELRFETGAAVVLVHHDRKPQQGVRDDDWAAARGGGKISTDPTFMVRLTRQGRDGLVQLRVTKANNDEPGPAIWLAIGRDGQPVPVDSPIAKAEANRDKVHQAAQAAPGPISAEQIASSTGLSADTVVRHLKALGWERLGPKKAGSRWVNSASGPLAAESPAELSDELF